MSDVIDVGANNDFKQVSRVFCLIATVEHVLKEI